MELNEENVIALVNDLMINSPEEVDATPEAVLSRDRNHGIYLNSKKLMDRRGDVIDLLSQTGVEIQKEIQEDLDQKFETGVAVPLSVFAINRATKKMYTRNPELVHAFLLIALALGEVKEKEWTDPREEMLYRLFYQNEPAFVKV